MYIHKCVYIYIYICIYMYIYIYIYKLVVPAIVTIRYLSHKAIVVKTGRAHCFHDYIYMYIIYTRVYSK